MDCPEVREKFLDYLGEELSDGELRAVDLHLARCIFCMEELDEIDKTLRICRTEIRYPSFANRFEELRTCLDAMDLPREVVALRPRRRVGNIFRKVALVAGIVLLIATSPFWMQQGRVLLDSLPDSADLTGASTWEGWRLPFVRSFVQHRVNIEEYQRVARVMED